MQTIASLQRILKKYDYSATSSVHMPALLRYTPYITTEESFAYFFSCTARLLINELDNPDSQKEDTIDEICKLFEGGVY